MPKIGNPVGGPKHKPQWAKDIDAKARADGARAVERERCARIAENVGGAAGKKAANLIRTGARP